MEYYSEACGGNVVLEQASVWCAVTGHNKWLVSSWQHLYHRPSEPL